MDGLEQLDRKVITIVLDDATGDFEIDWRGVPWLQFVGAITEVYAGILNGDLWETTYGAAVSDDAD